MYADFEDGDINWGGSNDNQNITQELIGVPVSCRIMPALNENIVRSIFNSRGDVASKEEDVSFCLFVLFLVCAVVCSSILETVLVLSLKIKPWFFFPGCEKFIAELRHFLIYLPTGIIPKECS